MKKVSFLFYLACSLTCGSLLNAQTKFDVPQNVTLKVAEDYPKYETEVVNAAKWLEETDLNKETDKRQKVNAFVLQWASGSPTVSLEINEQLGKIYGDNAQLLGMYIASYCRHYIENKSSATKFSATKAALISMMNVYKKKIDIKKSKEMEKILKLSDTELDAYIKEKLK
jgi:hypothetical protein